MRYKTSCFNPVLCRNYLRRFWPLPAAVLLTVLLTLLLPLVGRIQCSGLTEKEWLLSLLVRVYNIAPVMIILMMIAALLAAALTFHHLHSRKEIQFYHALPLKRRCLFLTCYLSGIGMVAVPFAVGVLLCMVVTAASGAGAVALPLLELLGAGMAALLIFYALAVVACCVAGQTFGVVLVYGGLNAAILIIAVGAGRLASMFMPGLCFTHQIADWLTPAIRLIRAAGIRYPAEHMDTVVFPCGFAEPAVLWIYAAAGVLLSVLAGVFYQIRRSEMAGEMIAFPILRHICKLFGALVVTVGGAFLFLTGGLFQEKIPFSVILPAVVGFGAIGWFGAEMVVQKTLRVFGRRTTATCCIFLVLLVAVSFVGWSDLTGAVRYIPKPEEVASAEVSYFSGSPVQMTAEDAETIHRAVLENRQELANNTIGNYYMLEIRYGLKNGRTVLRSYQVQSGYDADGRRLSDPIAQATLKILRTPDYCRQTWFGDMEEGVTKENFHYGSFQAYNWDETGKRQEYVTSDNAAWRGDYMDLTAAEAAMLYQAILQDIEEGNLLPWGFDTRDGAAGFGCLEFECYKEAYSPAFGTYQQYVDRVETQYASVELNTDMTQTIKCLEEMGIAFHLDERND